MNQALCIVFNFLNSFTVSKNRYKDIYHFLSEWPHYPQIRGILPNWKPTTFVLERAFPELTSQYRTIQFIVVNGVALFGIVPSRDLVRFNVRLADAAFVHFLVFTILV